ncbi:MAG: hypothetical protein Tp1111DCM1112741_52 [Prokaryotic dsDNA virus sp.]|nr:MAG: hypothetical protein Tp1111DCM1112741_52 [Prokaryotic dsDNA virus sp.]|tara:strand:+ start:4702 stop:5070 length:369 start_codon:yes stop_codon:yes gene_type:complete
MMKIHDMTNVKDYSVEYDKIMNTNLEIIYNANKEYNSLKEMYSFSVDPKYTYIKSVPFGVNGYTHPVHNKWVDDILEYMGIEKNACLDSPRHNNKLRYSFKSYEEAVAALFMVKKSIDKHHK